MIYNFCYTHILVYMNGTNGLQHEWSINYKLEKRERKRLWWNQSNIPEHAWRVWQKERLTTVGTLCFLKETRTDTHTNMSLDLWQHQTARYQYNHCKNVILRDFRFSKCCCGVLLVCYAWTNLPLNKKGQLSIKMSPMIKRQISQALIHQM